MSFCAACEAVPQDGERWVAAIIKPSRIACLVQTEPVEGGGLTTITGFVLFDFDSPRALLTEQALWPLVAEQMPKGSLFDKCRPKPLGEMIVAGHAMSADGKPVTGLRVEVRLGSIRKRLAVFGDRFWRLADRGIELIGALPFDSMPVDLSHAFGGPGSKSNPRGKGHNARAMVEAGFDAPLPNVEDAARLIRSVDDNPPPAHFGPIAHDDPYRMKLIGTYDQHWIRKVAPLRPHDFNPLFNNEAPADQRLHGYFSGDETFAISGMSRGTGVVSGRLPNLRMRAFVHKSSGDEFIETGMACDTVTLFPNVRKGALAFRGLCKGSDRFGEDLGTIMLALEHAEAAPRPVQYYQETFRVRTDPQSAARHVLSDFQLMPERDPAEVAAKRAAKLEAARQQRDKALDDQRWGVERILLSQGQSPELLPKRDGASIDGLPLVAMPTSEEIERGELDIAALIDDVRTLETEMHRRADEQRASVELIRRKVVETTPEGRLPKFLRKPIVDEAHLARFPEISIPDAIQQALESVDDRIRAARGAGGHHAEEVPAGTRDAIANIVERAWSTIDAAAPEADPEELERLYRIACARVLKLPEGQILHPAREAVGDSFVDRMMKREAGPAAGDDSTEARIERAFESIPDMIITPGAASLGLDPDVLLRTDPDVAPAMERYVAGRRKSVEGANELIRKVVPHMVPEGQDDNLIGAILARVQPLLPPAGEPTTVGAFVEDRRVSALDRIEKAATDVEDATAIARRTSLAALFPSEPLPESVAERLGAFVAGKLTEGADLKGGDLAGAIAPNLDFRGLDLEGTFFERANLAGADFTGARLRGAVFTSAVLDGADFTGTDLTQANLSGISASGAKFDRAVIAGTTLMKANLSDASAIGATLSRLIVIDSVLDRLDLSEARIDKLQFMRGSAEHMRLDRATITETVFMMVPMPAASLSQAVLERVSFTGIGAAGAVFADARMKGSAFTGDCDLTAANFDRIEAERVGWNFANLAESSFVRARCEKSIFNGCDMSAADLRAASLKGCMFVKAVLADADMFGANFLAGSLSRCDLRRASMRGANLYGVDLMAAKLAFCDLSGANLGMTLLEQPCHA